MTTYRRNAGDGLAALFRGRKISRGAAWGVMIVGALLAFEMFNFSTTEFFPLPSVVLTLPVLLACLLQNRVPMNQQKFGTCSALGYWRLL